MFLKCGQLKGFEDSEMSGDEIFQVAGQSSI